MGTFTACFDLGVGLGAPIAGAAAALGGYGCSFAVAALAAIGASTLARRSSAAAAAARGAGAADRRGPLPSRPRDRTRPRRGAAADPDCLGHPMPTLTRPAEPLRFGVTPLAAGSAGSRPRPRRSPEDRAAAIDRLARALQPPGRELVLRLNRMFWSDGVAGIRRYARIVDRFAAAGFATELQVRYHPPDGQGRRHGAPGSATCAGRSGSSAGGRASSPCRSRTRRTSTSPRTPPTAAIPASASRSSAASSPPSTSCARSAAATSSSASRSPGAGCRAPIASSGRSSAAGQPRASGAPSTTSACRSIPASSSRRRSRPARAPAPRPSRRSTLMRRCYMPKAGHRAAAPTSGSPRTAT